MPSQPYVRHEVDVDEAAGRWTCSCGQLLYLGPSIPAGESAEAAHIRAELSPTFVPPSTHVGWDWDRALTIFMLGWLLSDRD